jgi:hypothetical protein
MAKHLIDTDVYIDFLQSGQFHAEIARIYAAHTPGVYFSSVVSDQLSIPNTQHLYVWHTKMWIWKAAKMAGAACPTLKWQDRKTVGRAVPAIKLARLQHNSRSWCTAHIAPSIQKETTLCFQSVIFPVRKTRPPGRT